MHLHLPNTERLSESTRTAREAFWLTIICGVAVYAFFMVIGSVSPSGAAVATLVAGVLLVLYAGHAWYASRHMDSRDPRVIRARAARGILEEERRWAIVPGWTVYTGVLSLVLVIPLMAVAAPPPAGRRCRPCGYRSW